MKRIVTIGFEPWGQHTVNTSWDALQAARPHLPDGVLLEKRQLRVSWSRANSLVEEVFAGEPDAVLAFGQAPRDVVSLEALAFNQASVTEADNDGILREERVIDSGGPDQFDSSLPIKAILERLQAQGIGCERSLSAGDYLCNYLFYRIMQVRAIRGHEIPAGFVHVPLIDRMPLETTQTAVESVLEVIGRSLGRQAIIV